MWRAAALGLGTFTTVLGTLGAVFTLVATAVPTLGAFTAVLRACLAILFWLAAAIVTLWLTTSIDCHGGLVVAVDMTIVGAWFVIIANKWVSDALAVHASVSLGTCTAVVAGVGIRVLLASIRWVTPISGARIVIIAAEGDSGADTLHTAIVIGARIIVIAHPLLGFMGAS